MAEDIKIMRGSTLNSYNRCSITRLVIDKQESNSQHEYEDNSVEQAALEKMPRKRVAKDRLDRAQCKEQMGDINNISKRNQKRKYAVIDIVGKWK